MKILGEPIFAKNQDGSLKSRIGTLFLRTPGLVTIKGIHALQRLAWVDEVNRVRAEAGEAPLTREEADAQMADSVDLIFTPELVLIRPDPNRMDLAFQADTALQGLVAKSCIRFLNTNAAKVRDALRARGENWRMARPPVSPEEMEQMLASAKTSIACAPIYLYNRNTGTRYLTAGAFAEVLNSADDESFVAQVAEIKKGLFSHNRFGQNDVALFPSNLTQIRESFKSLDTSDAKALRAACEHIARQWRVALPAQLRVEKTSNFEWRNEMCATLLRGPNETTAAEQDLIQGISPEFYRQIEWLPGARIVEGELIFEDCDSRVRAILFNMMRLFSSIEYVNIGRVVRSLARHPVAEVRRGGVYLLQCKEKGFDKPRVFVIRFQKWGVAEHLDEGKDLLRATLEAADYSDYILDRRLACLQLGMKLPRHIGFEALTETYQGDTPYRGTKVRSYYYVRSYVKGTASDKLPPERFRNPAFQQRFAELMGEAAAIDLIVGRRITETNAYAFDQNYEVFQFDETGLPVRLIVTDHAGSFVDYLGSYEDGVKAYADVIRRRAHFVTDVTPMARAYVAAFERCLAQKQQAYRARKRAFDELFAHRTYDTRGSGAYRWKRILERLDACDPSAVARVLSEAISA